MSMVEVRRQMPASAGRIAVRRGEAALGAISDETEAPRQATGDAGSGLLERALARENLQRAWKRVTANQGAAGIDGMDIDQTGERLKTAWPDIKAQLLAGAYRPSPVRRVGIPKPDGGERELEMPTQGFLIKK